jgi:hypothetical protein
MALLSPDPSLRTLRRAGRAALALLLTLWAAAPGRAAEDGVYYSRQTTFRIPFQVDAGDRRVQEVLLHVSEDQGRSYRLAGRANPANREFTYQAPRDGWYYFTVQTRDLEGRLYPPSVDGVEAGLKVLVDTTLPEVTLRVRPPSRPQLVSVEWDVRDEHLDAGSLRLDYRGTGQNWMPRNIPRVASGQLSWDPGIAGPVEVRLQARDRAGNVGEATVTVRGDGTPVRRHVEDSNLPGAGGEHAPKNIRKVNSTKISLNYKLDDVGPSGISLVEVWMTTTTRDWTSFARDTTSNPPIVVDVKKEGRYGFTLVAKSGVQLGEQPPRSGDQPQVWVEVDLTRPVVEDVQAVVGRGANSGSLFITWRASDKNLSQRPISIYYSKTADGKWQPIQEAVGLDNSGRFVWHLPEGIPFEFYIRVEALDEAGNIGEGRTPQSVKVDLSLPKVRVIGIEPARP